jgi:hypothetical protein
VEAVPLEHRRREEEQLVSAAVQRATAVLPGLDGGSALRSSGHALRVASPRRFRHRACLGADRSHSARREPMGRILLGVIIGVILVIWLLASCLGAIF